MNTVATRLVTLTPRWNMRHVRRVVVDVAIAAFTIPALVVSVRAGDALVSGLAGFVLGILTASAIVEYIWSQPAERLRTPSACECEHDYQRHLDGLECLSCRCPSYHGMWSV